MVSFRGQIKPEPRPVWSPLGFGLGVCGEEANTTLLKTTAWEATLTRALQRPGVKVNLPAISRYNVIG